MRFPRNLTLYRFGDSPSVDIAANLVEHRVREPGPLELATVGFRPAAGQDEQGPMTVEGDGATAFAWASIERVLPAAAVNDALDRKVRQLAREEGRKVGGRERRRLREDLLNELIPKAPTRERRVAGWIDTREGWLVIDTSSRKTAERVLSSLREAFGSFPAVPLAPEEGPRVLMTDWLGNDNLPDCMRLGDEAELRDPATATGATARLRHQELDSDEIREHLRNGKQVFALGLTMDDRLDLVLREDLTVAKVRPLDLILDSATEAEDTDTQAQADFVLALLEIRRLLAWLASTFKTPRPAKEG